MWGLLNIILLIGGIQGLLFTAIILFSERFRERSNNFLALLILTFSLNNLQYFLYYTEIISAEVFYGIIYIPYGWIDVVFLYLYVKTFLFPHQKLKKREWLWALPFAAALLTVIYLKITYTSIYLPDRNPEYIEEIGYLHEFGSLAFSIILFYLGFKEIKKIERLEKISLPHPFLRNINWLKKLYFLIMITGVFWLIGVINEIITESSNNFYYLSLWILLSLIIYILGHVGLYKFGIQTERKKIRSYYKNFNRENNNAEFETIRLVSQQITTAQKIKSSGLPSSENKHIQEFVKFIKEDKNFLDSNLSSEATAEKLGINKSYLSRLIKSELQTTFNDYVNKLRVEEAQRYLLNPEFEHYTLISIGLEAGFNSKSTYNKCFKKFTGVSPSQFRKQNLNPEKEIILKQN